jgi:hypothetical protein
MIKYKAVILLLIFPISSLSQEPDMRAEIAAFAEELAADENDPAAAELFTDRLYDLNSDPVKINSGNEDELCRLFFLTGFQVRALADYVKTTGRIVSPYEIANIPGFDRETTEMMLPFISFESSSRTQSGRVKIRHTLLSNFITKSSLSDTLFPGSPWKILTKYKFRAGRFSGGLTMEKDPGEKLIYGKPPLPDFFSGHLDWQGSGFIKKVIIGDYSACFGQGSGINTGLRTGLPLTASGYLAGKSEIRSYTSTEENNFFRGIATEFSFKNLDVSLFFSSNRIDATLNDAGSSIRSLYSTGLHNSTGTIRKKDVVGELSYGLHLSYNFKKLRTGILWTENRFSLPFIPEIVSPTDRYDFKGNKNTLYTIYYNSFFRRFIFFGEFSYSGSNKHALIQGMSLRPAERLNVNLIYRNYSPGYVSFHGNGSGGSSLNNNGSDILGNFTLEAAKFLFVSAGSDIRYFPWMSYRCSAPSRSIRYEARIRYLPSDRFSFETVYSSRNSMADNNSRTGVPVQEEVISKSVRGYVKYSPAGNIVFGTRIDFKLADPSGSKGTLLLQDINIRFRKLPVAVWARYCIFNTGGFESGIYTWENDLLNSFNIPVMYGSGSRSYIMIAWKPLEKIEFRIKYALTTLEAIATTVKNTREVKIQLRINI